MRAKKAVIGARVHIIASKDAGNFGMITDIHGTMLEVTADNGSKSFHTPSELHAETKEHIEKREAMKKAEAEAHRYFNEKAACRKRRVARSA